ncbi:MAG TPA: GlsB/YeaQ/YmgE family stress response membrane protein [Tepidisphaeraceae bacterium]|jgi:uncharacterized membrane protein YeaQ/YmgE (transglycosylase-associated protein family)
MFVNLIGWSLLGLIIGEIAGRIFRSAGDDPKLDLLVGVAGAVVGGALAGLAGAHSMASFNPWSLAFAPAGAIALLLTWHGFRSFATRRR